MLQNIREKISNIFENIDKEYIIIGVVIVIIIICIIFTSKSNSTENVVEEQKTAEENEEKLIEEKENEEKSNIFVHIDGMVNSPGLIQLTEGARLNDAIEKANGLNEKADMELINLAMELEDGTKIYIPSVDDRKNNKENAFSEDSNLSIASMNEYNLENTTSNSTNTNTNNQKVTKTNNSSSVSSSKKKSGKVNINKAGKEELMTLNGVGSSTADKIIEYRQLEGEFKKKEDLLEVSGIGDSKFNKIKDNVTI